jgi:alkylation response protein AidB-like acyl-CoA dehydrogenase
MYADIHDEFRAVARGLLGKAPPGREADWRLLAGAGWLGLEVPGALDGEDATFAETAVIAAELGRAAASSPYLSTVVLGAGTLNLLEPAPGRDELRRGVANGHALIAVALPDTDAGTDDDTDTDTGGTVPFRLEYPAGQLDGFRLRGQAAFVPDAAEAGHLLLLARDPDGMPVIAALIPGEAGLSVSPQPVLDQTRRLALVTADGAGVSRDAVWRFGGDPRACVRRLLDRAAVAVACDSLGVAGAMLDATVAYARVREQFGRPIGAFQAVKHACADMLVQVSVARELVAAAAQRLAEDALGDPATSVAASMAKSYACAAAVDVAGKAMQLHGGIGYTWESGIHVFLKRAALNRSLSGSPAAHRQRLAARYRAG